MCTLEKLHTAHKAHTAWGFSRHFEAAEHGNSTLGIVGICLSRRVLAKQGFCTESHSQGDAPTPSLFLSILWAAGKWLLLRQDSMPRSHGEENTKAGSEARSINVSVN